MGTGQGSWELSYPSFVHPYLLHLLLLHFDRTIINRQNVSPFQRYQVLEIEQCLKHTVLISEMRPFNRTGYRWVFLFYWVHSLGKINRKYIPRNIWNKNVHLTQDKHPKITLRIIYGTIRIVFIYFLIINFIRNGNRDEMTIKNKLWRSI